jgi:hypothetical protein
MTHWRFVASTYFNMNARFCVSRMTTTGIGSSYVVMTTQLANRGSFAWAAHLSSTEHWSRWQTCLWGGAPIVHFLVRSGCVRHIQGPMQTNVAMPNYTFERPVTPHARAHVRRVSYFAPSARLEAPQLAAQRER